MYLGHYGSAGNCFGLRNLVKQRNPVVDTKLKARLMAADKASQAITQNPTAVHPCQALVDGAVATAVDEL